MSDSDGEWAGIPVRTKWLRFGLVIGVAHLLFLALVVALLRIDLVLGVVVAVALSTVGGLAIVLYVLRVA